MWNFLSSAGVDRKANDVFMKGKACGIEEGVLKGMAMNFERSKELSEQEYQEVIEFLVKRGLELCCYDVHRGGFRVRKRL